MKDYLDVGGNQDNSRGFIDVKTYTIANNGDETKIDDSNLQNGEDYRGHYDVVRYYWIEDWNESDNLRFQYRYINSQGTEYIDNILYNANSGKFSDYDNQEQEQEQGQGRTGSRTS